MILLSCNARVVAPNLDKLSPVTRQLVSVINDSSKKVISEDVIKKFGLSDQSGTYVVGGLVQVEENFDERVFSDLNIKQRTNAGGIRTVTMPVRSIAELSTRSAIKYIEIDNALSTKEN